MRIAAPVQPSYGDSRLVKAFAWWPVVIGEQVVWLESYWKDQIYTMGFWDEVSHWRTVGLHLKEAWV